MTQPTILLQYPWHTVRQYGLQHLRTSAGQYRNVIHQTSTTATGTHKAIIKPFSGKSQSFSHFFIRSNLNTISKSTRNTEPIRFPSVQSSIRRHASSSSRHDRHLYQGHCQKRFKSTVTSGQRTASARTQTQTQTQRPTITISRLKSFVNEKLLRPRTLPIPRWISPRPFSFTVSECFGHASFVLVAVSYALDDFLYLRIIAVAGSSCMLFFTYFHPHGRVLWLPFKWNVLFILINSYRIARTLYYQNMGERLDENMKRIKHDYFDLMDLVDFAKLTSIAREEVYDAGNLILHQGQKNHCIRMVIEGEMDVVRDGIKTYTLYEGNFISEAGLHAGLLLKGSIESCCTIVASDTSKRVRCLVWNRSELIELLKREGGLRRALKAALSWDIVRKLKGQRKSLTDHKVEDPALWTQKRKEQSEDRYAAILQNILQHEDDDFGRRRVELDHYRKIHHIDEDKNRMALERCGWTVEEYEAGRRKVIIHEK